MKTGHRTRVFRKTSWHWECQHPWCPLTGRRWEWEDAFRDAFRHAMYPLRWPER